MLREGLKKPYVRVLILVLAQAFVIRTLFDLLATDDPPLYLLAGIISLAFQRGMYSFLESHAPRLHALWKRRWGWIFCTSLLIVTLQAMYAVHDPSSLVVRHPWVKDLPLGLLSLCFFHLGAHSVRDAEELNEHQTS